MFKKSKKTIDEGAADLTSKLSSLSSDKMDFAKNREALYDAKTGEKLALGTKADGKKTINYNQLIKRWPYNAQTGEKLPWGTKIDNEKVISYQNLKDRWPYDSRTGKKLELGATGEHVVPYHRLNRLHPIDKYSGELLPYGVDLKDNVVTRHEFYLHHTFEGSDGKVYKGESQKEKALAENPDLTFKSKKEVMLEKNRKKREKTRKPSSSKGLAKKAHKKKPEEKSLKKSNFDRSHSLSRYQRDYDWPYDAETGKKLPWGKKVDGKKIINYRQRRRRWPHDAATGKKLPWGTEVDGEKVLAYHTIEDRWPYDSQTGKRLEWGATGEHVVLYRRLNRLRPVDKDTGTPLPYGTPIGENVITRYSFYQNNTFVASNDKVYKSKLEKEKALAENPDLTFKSRLEILQEKRRKKTKAKIQEKTSTSSQPDSSASASAAEHSQGVDFALNLLLKAVDTSAPQVQAQPFAPSYEGALNTDNTTSDGTSAKKSKKHDEHTAHLILSLNPSSR